MVLTKRDEDIIRQMHRFRFMTTEQVRRLLFSPSTASICIKRLRLLFDHGYLARFPLVPGVPTGKLVYRLGREGAKRLAEEQGVSPRTFRYWAKNEDRHHPGQTEIGREFLRHELKIGDVRIAVIRAARQSGYTLETWTDTTALKSTKLKDYVTIARERGGTERRALIPDAYFALQLAGKPAHFFLEVDYGSETLKKWKVKLKAYLAYTKPAANGPSAYQKRYQTTVLRILTVAPSEGRLRNLLKTTEAESDKKFFWFTTFDEVAQNDILSSPIWLQAHDAPDRGRKPLVVSPSPVQNPS